MRDSSTITIERRAATSLEQIYADVKAAFESARFDVAADQRRVRVRHKTTCSFGNVRLEFTECVGGHMRGQAKGLIDIGVTIRGGVLARHPTFERGAGPGEVATWAAPGHALDVEVKPGTLIGSLRITPERVVRAGRALLGDEFRIATTATAPVPDIIGSTIARNIMQIYGELVELERVDISWLVTAAFEELLANLTVCMMRPELFLSETDEANCQRSIARRAEEILVARAMEPVTISAVAEELGVTVRALQASFRKHGGQSPLQFLLARRIAIARDRLLSPDLRDNVQSIAMGCGFLSMSKFSNRYRATYGELPSETLARNRAR